MLYNVSFVRNDVCQANLASAKDAETVKEWFRLHKPSAVIIAVSPATRDDEKPGKPCIKIDN